ncbi:hypothetical protein AAG906_013157 [Vitis piasezkii]
MLHMKYVAYESRVNTLPKKRVAYLPYKGIRNHNWWSFEWLLGSERSPARYELTEEAIQYDAILGIKVSMPRKLFLQSPISNDFYSTMAEWADLPSVLLHLITKRLDSHIDLLRFQSVCKSWRSSTPSKPRSIFSNLPISPMIGFSKINYAFSLSKRSILQLGLPDSCPNNPNSWLIKIEEDPSEGANPACIRIDQRDCGDGVPRLLRMPIEDSELLVDSRGLALVGYGIYLSVEYKKSSSETLTISPVKGDSDVIQLGRPVMMAVTLSSSILDNLPKAWFIYSFITVGVILFVISCFGCVGAVTRKNCCLSYYAVLVILLILIELGCAAFIFFDKSWEDDIPTDKSWRH